MTLEALSCGTPVIASPVIKPSIGDVPNFIQNDKSGILIPINNPSKLATAIEYLLENEDVRVKLGKNGRKHVMEHFSWDAVSKRLVWIYNELHNCMCT